MRLTAANLMVLVGIALLDSLNPTLIAGELFILSARRPRPRAIAFIAGVITTNFLGGLLLAAGLQGFAVALLRDVNGSTWTAIEVVLGLVLVGFGILYSAKTDKRAQLRRRPSEGVAGPFVFGGLMMINELTTAAPYFAAIALMSRADFSQIETVAGLVVYNAVFAVPLIGFLVGYMAMRQRFAGFAISLSEWVERWARRILKYGSLIFGVVLLADAAYRTLW
jgi:cytochrome c biogenesis protein CcdA